ncbi:hypothetical protein QT327_04660 [Olivibacter sp. 47]|uniref:hypothetical protein n=1 Tax=Olivibacter sp. 47 TaxID=3056486 RepID=UPI0025A46254|nr:hypothetical protein [Olivibacter sp. 47]MDM8173658.1 hypothetical protein [Olivibacter sp. 47]
MSAFYSILYCTIRPNQGERISIGLFMADGERCFFSFSKEKLNILKELIPGDAFSLLKSNLRAISELANAYADDFMHAHKSSSILSESYFSYLSVYANNLLTFSAPTKINITLDQNNFNRLFEKFVFNIPVNRTEKVSKIDIVRKRLAKSIAKRVNFDVEMTENEVPGLIVPSKVTFVGKNNVEVVGEMSDFTKALYMLKQQVGSHLFLVDKMKEKNKDTKFFFIGDEPSKKLPEHHSIWKSIKTYSAVQLVPTSEVDLIEEYMDTHHVEPFFSN